MKAILTALVTAVVMFSVQAQPVTLKKKDGTVVNTRVSAINNTTLFTPVGSIPFADLASASFEAKQQKDQTTYDRLSAAGVAVDFTGAPIVADQPVVTAQKEDPSIEQLKQSLARFRDARQMGKGMQLLGIGLFAAGNALYMSDPTANKDLGTALVAGGGLSFLIGLGIDLGAGNHLKF